VVLSVVASPGLAIACGSTNDCATGTPCQMCHCNCDVGYEFRVDCMCKYIRFRPEFYARCLAEADRQYVNCMTQCAIDLPGCEFI
jgi:hypothetical protein